MCTTKNKSTVQEITGYFYFKGICFCKDEWREKFSLFNQHFQLLSFTVCNIPDLFLNQEIIVAQLHVKSKENQQGVAVLSSSHSMKKLSRKKSDYLTKLYNNLGGGRLEFSPAIYGTKVAQVKQVPNKYSKIIGGSYPNNVIILNGLQE